MPKPDEKYSDAEAKNRFEAALKGARIVGHKPLESLTRKKKSKKRPKRIDDANKR